MCVSMAISRVPSVPWGQECWWYFQLTGNSCFGFFFLLFWATHFDGGRELRPTFIFFGRIPQMGNTSNGGAVCHQTPEPAVQHSSVSCSTTWHVGPGVGCRRERPASCWGTARPAIRDFYRSAHFSWRPNIRWWAWRETEETCPESGVCLPAALTLPDYTPVARVTHALVCFNHIRNFLQLGLHHLKVSKPHSQN